MKRFLCAIAMLVAFIPFIGVKALNETTNYYSYKKGQIVNFYPNATAEAERNRKALETIIVEDKDTSNRFIKVWSMSGVGMAGGSGVFNTTDDLTDGTPLPTTINNLKTAFKNNVATAAKISTGAEDATEGNYFLDFTDATRGLNMVTMDDLKTMFGDALVKEAAPDTYSLNDFETINRAGEKTSLYKEMELLKDIGTTASIDGTKNGFFVLNYDETTHEYNINLAKFIWKADGTLESITIVPGTNADKDTEYMFLPTAYANKTADCHENVVEEHCYKCVNENGKFIFVWTTPGDKSVESCELQNDITSKKDCSELVKTGVESHILEFGIVAALCVIALIVVKRRDLFKTI